jgi:DNA ligase-1
MIPQGFKPLLADKLPKGSEPLFPCYVSPKLDGIRAHVFDGVVYSRKLKPIPNAFAQKLLGRKSLQGFDGELTVGSAASSEVFRATTSGIMSAAGEPDIVYHVFDIIEPGILFSDRLSKLKRLVGSLPKGLQERVLVVPQFMVSSMSELVAYEERFLALGYEGLMARSIDGEYKFGRSTVREGILLKVKRFEDSEARILGLEELQNNHNSATLDALGHTKRSTNKSGKVGAGVLGALLVEDVHTGAKFSIGSGFSAAERSELWGVRHTLIGQLAKYRFFPTGSKEAPRFPTWQGIRDERDT